MAEGHMYQAAPAAPPGRTYRVRSLADAEEIRALLRERPAYAAYALGQLEPHLAPRARWWLASGATGRALLLHASGGLGQALFAMGDPDALDAILRLHPGPPHTYATCEPRHVAVLRRYFRLAQEQPMLRMSVTPDRLRTPELHADAETPQVRRLTGADARWINRLYSSDGAPTYYSPAHINEGVYYGASVAGRLVSVAGTHVVSPEQGVAVVGNVFTHPRYRGRGYAQVTTGAVTRHLLRTCPLVVLSVDPANTPAVRAYQRLGYVEDCRLIEAAATRRELLGAASLTRRLLARLRGWHEHLEVVRL
ncbi:MAG TPA: GNAT family N-acetyltransferase [Dehalococcoidia bacterium]